jgi:adenylate kinase family enzyme
MARHYVAVSRSAPSTVGFVQRIVVVGCSGTGKSTVARQVADRLGLAHIELDSLWHLPGWEHRPPEEFRCLLAARMEAAVDGWVICGNYVTPSEQLHLDPGHNGSADTVVWLDLPRWLVMRRIVWRTVRRVVTRQQLWGVVREPWSNLYSWDPEKNIIRWAWTTHAKYRADYSACMVDGTWSHLTVHRLRTPGEVDRLVGGLGPTP